MRGRQWGTSLVSGMAVILFFGLLALLTGPLFYRVLGDQRVAQFSGTLVSQLNKARYAALYENVAVSLCSSDDGRHCTDTPWARGYIAFVDRGTPGVVDGNDRIIGAVAGSDQDSRLRVSLNSGSVVRFERNGSVVAVGAASTPVAYLPEHPSLLAALAPFSAAYADEREPAATAVFLVCSGSTGRAVKMRANGMASINSVTCTE